MQVKRRFAQAADQNKDDIFAVLKDLINPNDFVLELGSGTGQHVCHFAEMMPDVTWQPSELQANLADIAAWIEASSCHNIRTPIELDLNCAKWPSINADCCYTANTLHIVSEETGQSLFKGCSQVLNTGGKLCAYGPFKQDGKHVSDSNARFDEFLRQSNSASGVREVADLNDQAIASGFQPAQVISMPVNNRVLVWTLGD